METLNLTVTDGQAGRRLDLAALELLGDDFSRSQVQRLLKQGCIILDGRPARAAQKVNPGEQITVSLPPAAPVDLVPEPIPLKVLFEDEHLVVINKPPGMVVHPAPGHDTGTLVHALLHHCGELAQVGGKLRPGIVHRLDKDTSGALVAAKNDKAHRGLVAAFAAGAVQKEYLALVLGSPALAGEASTGIGRHPVDRKRMSSSGRHTKPALSNWRVVRYFSAGLCLVRVRIYTGRTHQIRVHMSEAGFPVAGDPMYGGVKGLRRQGPEVRTALNQAGRQMLHALQLGFKHPVTAEPVKFTAPLPGDFRRVLRVCEQIDSA